MSEVVLRTGDVAVALMEGDKTDVNISPFSYIQPPNSQILQAKITKGTKK